MSSFDEIPLSRPTKYQKYHLFKFLVEKCLKYIDIKHVHVFLYTKKIWCKLLLLQESFKAVTLPHCSIFEKHTQLVWHQFSTRSLMSDERNVWSHSSVTTSSLISNHQSVQNALCSCMWHILTDIMLLSSYLRSSRAAERPVSQALQTQTITILKRQIPSLEWSYWFPSEYAQSRSLFRHQSNTAWHNFTTSLTSSSKPDSFLDDSAAF